MPDQRLPTAPCQSFRLPQECRQAPPHSQRRGRTGFRTLPRRRHTPTCNLGPAPAHDSQGAVRSSRLPGKSDARPQIPCRRLGWLFRPPIDPQIEANPPAARFQQRPEVESRPVTRCAHLSAFGRSRDPILNRSVLRTVVVKTDHRVAMGSAQPIHSPRSVRLAEHGCNTDA